MVRSSLSMIIAAAMLAGAPARAQIASPRAQDVQHAVDSLVAGVTTAMAQLRGQLLQDQAALDARDAEIARLKTELDKVKPAIVVPNVDGGTK